MPRPSNHHPAMPPGVTYTARATRLEDGSGDKPPSHEHGPEFPETPSARSHTVDEQHLTDKAVIDHGVSLEETGPDMPSDEDVAPREETSHTDAAAPQSRGERVPPKGADPC